MINLNFGLLLLAGFLVGQSFVILGLFRQAVNRLAEVNKQLLIVVAGKEEKPESALRALVASSKPPQGKLGGIANKKAKDDKPKNTNYTMSVGG